jgi:Kef-type K+ transport system membrane component KefB
MMAITGFLVAVWCAGKISRRIGISSIVMEVGVGLILGPPVLGMMPGELTESYDDRAIDCDSRKYLMKIAEKGYEYCDLAAYQKENMYLNDPNYQSWNSGFFGTVDDVWLDGYKYCINPHVGCTPSRTVRRLSIEDGLEKWDRDTYFVQENATSRRLGGKVFFGLISAKTKEGQADKDVYDHYNDCLKESCILDRALKSATVPSIFVLIGHTGVAMMIFESGMHFDFDQAKTVGPWACAVAVFGTFLPLASGLALCIAYGYDMMEGLSVGVSLAPTSVGIALKLLHEAKALQMYFGQAVMTAAFVDDVLSLILFSVLFSLGPDMDFWSFFPLIVGCIFMAVTIIAAVKVFPPFMDWLFSKIPEDKQGKKVTRHDEVMWILMAVTLIIYAEITHECGTHLWGCFIAGMNFSTSHHAHHIWVRQVKRHTAWWLRIFFSCTLAWSIPVDELFSISAFWKGTIMGLGPCIAAKVFCAPFMGSARWAIGWAMVGRAEFAYFIAIMAKALKMMPDDLFAILIWALLYATIFAPLIFRKVLARYMVAIGEVDATVQEIGDDGTPIHHKGSILGGDFSASGHLPDFVEIENRNTMQEDKLKMEGLQAGYESQQAEIKNLQQQIADANYKNEQLAKDKEAADKELAEVKGNVNIESVAI